MYESKRTRHALTCISQHARRTVPLQIDPQLCKSRHRIENLFCILTEFKRIAMRENGSAKVCHGSGGIVLLRVE